MKVNPIYLWKQKGKIAEGIKNSVFKQDHIEEIAAERIAICRTNVCGHYDPKGESPNAYFPGQESCGYCGCKSAWMVRSLSTNCSLIKDGKEPLWKAVVTEDEEQSIKNKINTKNNLL